MGSKGKDPKAVDERDEDLVKVDTEFPLREDLLSNFFKSRGKDAKEGFIKRNAEFLLTATDLELLAYYLQSKIFGDSMIGALMIPEVDIYKYEPWGLPTLAPFVSNEASSSFFFCPMVKNRATESGYWKETGSLITVGSGAGFKQVLTYYRGKPPRGESTDWLMFEYRLDRSLFADHKGIDPHSFVLCRLFNKSNYPFPDHVQGKEGFGVGEAGGSSVQSNLELGSDSESDSSVSELMDMFQKPETELMLNVSISSVQPNMYADGFTHLRFLTAPAAWEWFRGQVGNLIDSPEIKPFAQQVVEKCHSSPLIISAVGSALTAESSPSQWRLAVQRLHFRTTGDTNDSLNPCIRYCYDRLKDHDVKTCFLYSALVLENRQIHRSVLVKFFITEGLLGGTTMVAYKRANDIINMLVKASLLEASNETMMVRMHNMIRDSALAILSSSTEGCQMFLDRGLGKLGAEQVDKYLIKIGDQLKEPPPPEEWEQATVIFLMDNDFSTLPSKLYCPTLVSLFLQRNRYLRTVPASFFDGMHSLTNLNLSRTRIRSLPDSLFTLKSLQVLLLRDCEHLIILPSAIGRLTALEVLDLQGTELLNLPDTISELASLKTLKVSFYGSINHNEYNNLPRKLIRDGKISNLPLEELGMFVHPGDRRWTISVSDITKEVTGLLLTILYFHFPELQSLEYFLQGSKSWKNGNLTDFNFIVGHDFKHALSLVTRDAELMHRNSERCLRFVNGEAIPQGVMEVLKRATSLYLDHHVNICSLSDFGIYNMDALKVCILSDCPVVQAIIHLAEDGQVILPFVEYLSLNSLWNLEAIISGDHLFAEESFNMLTFLSLRACPKLTYVFTLLMMKNLPNLEELMIEDCVSLKYIISQEDLLCPDEFAVLPCLKVLKLYYLPNLSEIGRLSWANVEYMHFYNCPKLKNLCMTTDDTASIKEIAADKAWWDSLEWDEPLLSERLDKLFTQIQLDDL